MGAYSQGVVTRIGDSTLVLTAGQIAADSDGAPIAPGDIGAQTRIVFDRLESVLGEAGASLNDVVKVQIFLTDMSEFSTVSAIRNDYLDDINPVSTVVEIAATVIDGCDIEVEAMAVISNDESERA